MDIKQTLIDNAPLLQVIQHYEYKGHGLEFNTPHGKAIPKQFALGIRIEVLPYAPAQYASEIAKDKLIRHVSAELTYALAGKQLTDVVHVPSRYKQERDWLLLCSDETFYRFAESENTIFEPLAQRYRYDDLPLLRHNLPTDIFINTAKSCVFNLRCELQDEIIEETHEKTIKEYRLYVDGYWLIISDTAQSLA